MHIDYSYIGKGPVYLGPYTGGAMRDVGQASALAIQVTGERKELLDYQSPGGGQANTVFRIQRVAFNITMHNISPENLAVGAFGDVAAVAAGAVADEEHTAYKGGLVRFDNLPDPTESVTVTGAAGTPIYVEGTDYVRVTSGIEILEAGSIADEATLEIDYTKIAGSVVQAVTQSQREYKLSFAGLNEAQSGAPVAVDVHRLKFDPMQDWGTIGDEFAELVLEGEALRDASITGVGVSQFWRAEMALPG